MGRDRKYNVTVSHPTGYYKGTYILTVNDCYGKPGFKYVSGAGFGCSRDYAAKTDESAIWQFMPEHACTVLKIVKA